MKLLQDVGADPPRGKFRLVKLLFFPGIDVEDTPLNRAEAWELIKILFGVFTLVSLCLAILSFWLQRTVLEKEYHWRHMKEAQDILREWDHRTGEKKQNIESYFRRRYHWAVMQRVSRQDAFALRNAVSGAPNGDDELWRLRNDVVALLNYFETISTAALRGIADQDILKDTLGQPMIAWREYLREFTDLIDADQKRLVWQPYYDIIEQWKPKPLLPSPPTFQPRRQSHDWGSFERR